MLSTLPGSRVWSIHVGMNDRLASKLRPPTGEASASARSTSIACARPLRKAGSATGLSGRVDVNDKAARLRLRVRRRLSAPGGGRTRPCQKKSQHDDRAATQCAAHVMDTRASPAPPRDHRTDTRITFHDSGGRFAVIVPASTVASLRISGFTRCAVAVFVALMSLPVSTISS